MPSFPRLWLLLLLTAGLFAQESAPPGAKALFADPVELTAGDAPFEDQLFPTPVLYDLDGDQQDELVVGDLFGNLFACEPLEAEGQARQWSARSAWLADGEPLRLNNW